MRLYLQLAYWVSLLLLCGCYEKRASSPVAQQVPGYVRTLKQHATARYNQRIGFYLDLRRPSGQPRFFVLDLRRKQVLAAGLCCSGRTDAQGRVRYSNTPDSNCSSHGLAQVSYAYTGKFGRAYKLVGLQKTNSRIFERFIVLHSHDCVPAQPQRRAICRSQGCPTVNPAFLRVLSTYIDHSHKPILLYTN
ncbi:murein L,D-transpeptidase catalytic domain-containing protein [Hymenobacter pini]|uniref:murein L,D-transpeptidase catalytic domain-containing protein n=1 Tax=Hymenobacter pini TaxID=2880879 RepID=UPI001CF162A2|nr:murein L,D-transpeptidase catalytic domain family protein [Hymenobacter pini]MCA8830841.1 murein L,D-transpeptidase catalytic domain family protein [Hymenobacter pini]